MGIPLTLVLSPQCRRPAGGGEGDRPDRPEAIERQGEVRPRVPHPPRGAARYPEEGPAPVTVDQARGGHPLPVAPGRPGHRRDEGEGRPRPPDSPQEPLREDVSWVFSTHERERRRRDPHPRAAWRLRYSLWKREREIVEERLYVTGRQIDDNVVDDGPHSARRAGVYMYRLGIVLPTGKSTCQIPSIRNANPTNTGSAEGSLFHYLAS